MLQTAKVTILGAGPAGACAALKLNKLGIDVILIDKANFPRDKICGDGISHRVVDIMKRWLYPELYERFCAEKNIQLDSWGLRVEGTRSNNFEIGYRAEYNTEQDAPPGFVCKRVWFDNFLVEEVRRSEYVKFYENTEISQFEKRGNRWYLSDKSGDFQIETSLLIVADGAQSRFARKIAGIDIDPKHYMASVKAYYKNISGFQRAHFLEFYFLDTFLPGYFWIFPLPNGEANVGIAIVAETVQKRKLNLHKCLQEVIESEKFRARFSDAQLIGEVQGFGLPLASKKRNLSGDAYMLTGDAAGLIDPLTGEGIANAMLSGIVAAEQAAVCIRENNFSVSKLKDYDNRIYRMRGQEFQVSYWLQKQFKKQWFFNSLAWLVNRNKQLARTFAYVFNDVNLSKQLRSPTFWWKILRNKA